MWTFVPLDLVAPIGFCTLFAGLCVWGLLRSLKTQTTHSAAIVCAITAAAFLAAIPGWFAVRASFNKADYCTAQGLFVVQGKVNKCERAFVEPVAKELLAFWKMALKRDVSVKNVTLVCLDQEKITGFDRNFRGLSYDSFAVVGWNGNPDYTRSLIRHELSHQIVAPFIDPDEAVQHKLFSDVKLGD